MSKEANVDDFKNAMDINNDPLQEQQNIVNNLILVSIKAEKVRVLFNLLLENLNLNPRSSRKEFFDAMTELHDMEQEAQKQLGLLQAREAMNAKKATRNKGTRGSLSVSN